MIGSETRINSDDLHYFDKQSAVRPLPPQRHLPEFQASVLPYLEQRKDTLRAATRDEQIVARLLARYGFFDSKQDLIIAYCFMPKNGNVRYWMSREFWERPPDYDTFCGPRR
jgi:spermidine synthase